MALINRIDRPEKRDWSTVATDIPCTIDKANRRISFEVRGDLTVKPGYAIVCGELSEPKLVAEIEARETDRDVTKYRLRYEVGTVV